MANHRCLLLVLCVAAACTLPSAADPPLGDKNQRVDIHGEALPDGAIARLGATPLLHSATIQSLAFSPDGKILASSSDDKVSRLWDAATGKLLGQWNQFAYAPVFSPDGKTLAASSERNVVLVDVATAKPRQVLKPTVSTNLHSFAFVSDSQTLVTARSLEKEEGILLEHWDVKTGRPGLTVPILKARSPAVLAPAKHAAGKAILYAFDGKVVASWSAETGERGQEYQDHGGSVRQLAVSPGGELLASIGFDKKIRGSDTATGKQLLTLEDTLHVEQMAFSADCKTLMGVPLNGVIAIWDVGAGKLLHEIPRTHPGTCAAITADGKSVATTGAYRICIRDRVGAKMVPRWPGHCGEVTSVRFAPDGKSLATGGADGTVYHWPHLDGTKPRLLTDSLGMVFNVVYAPGRSLLAASGQKGVSLWDTPAGQQVGHREEAGRSGRALFFPDGKTLLVAEDWTSAWWWFIDTDKVRRNNEEAFGSELVKNNSSVLSPDGKTLIDVEAYSGKVTLLDPQTRERKPRGRSQSTTCSAAVLPFARRTTQPCSSSDSINQAASFRLSISPSPRA